MRQTLFYIPLEIGGLPVFGFGILFLSVFIVTIFFLVINRIRKGKREDFYTILSMGSCFALLFAFVAPRLCEAQGLPIRGYGVFLMLAIVSATLMLVWRGMKLWRIAPDRLVTVAIVSVISGLIGARIFFVVEYWDLIVAPTWRETILNIVNMAGGGLVVFGSIIGGTIGLFVYLLIKKMPVLATLDLFAPALMLGIALGRIGCLMNGCCYGGITDSPCAITFPPASPVHVRQLELGEASLSGIILKYQQQESEQNSESSLFNVKGTIRSRWTKTFGPVVIEAVEAGSPADKAGIKSGMTIVKIGYPAEKEVKDSRPALYFAARNADVFDFCIDAMRRAPEKDLMFVCSPSGDEKDLREFVFHPDYATVRPVHPSQIYSTLTALILCAILYFLGRFKFRDGILVMLMFILYSMARFCLELMRTDEQSFLKTGLSVSQCVALLVILVAGVTIAVLMKRSPRHRYEEILTKLQLEQNESSESPCENADTK